MCVCERERERERKLRERKNGKRDEKTEKLKDRLKLKKLLILKRDKSIPTDHVLSIIKC